MIPTSGRPTAASALLLWLCMGAQASAVPLSDDDFKVDVVKSMSRAVLADRLKGALWGVYIGDALAMPAHWYYDISQLRTDHGVIRGYVAAKTHMRGSILNLSNTGGGGRGGDSGTIVGEVINHGKRKYWKRGADYFYHQGLRAGENTLEAHVTRVLARSIADLGKYDPDAFLDGYVKFMTTPGSHNDTYAATAHRMFFANWSRKQPLRRCADNDGHNTDAIDCLTGIPVVAVATLARGAPGVRKAVREHSSLVRRSVPCEDFSEWFAGALVDAIVSGNVRTVAEKWGAKLGVDVPAMVRANRDQDPMTACYLQSAVPAMLHFAYKYGHSVEQGLLASVNAGGENVARSAALGTLYGAAVGFSGLPAWMVDGLVAREDISREVDAVVEVALTASGDASSPATLDAFVTEVERAAGGEL